MFLKFIILQSLCSYKIIARLILFFNVQKQELRFCGSRISVKLAQFLHWVFNNLTITMLLVPISLAFSFGLSRAIPVTLPKMQAVLTLLDTRIAAIDAQQQLILKKSNNIENIKIITVDTSQSYWIDSNTMETIYYACLLGTCCCCMYILYAVFTNNSDSPSPPGSGSKAIDNLSSCQSPIIENNELLNLKRLDSPTRDNEVRSPVYFTSSGSPVYSEKPASPIIIYKDADNSISDKDLVKSSQSTCSEKPVRFPGFERRIIKPKPAPDKEYRWFDSPYGNPPNYVCTLKRSGEPKNMEYANAQLTHPYEHAYNHIWNIRIQNIMDTPDWHLCRFDLKVKRDCLSELYNTTTASKNLPKSEIFIYLRDCGEDF